MKIPKPIKFVTKDVLNIDPTERYRFQPGNLEKRARKPSQRHSWKRSQQSENGFRGL
jgi:hypothetical protein